MTIPLRLLFPCLLFCLAGCTWQASPPPPESSTAPDSVTQRTWVSRAWRHEKEGWTFLHVQGAPRERGFQHGYLLVKEIRESLRVQKLTWYHDSGVEWTWLVETAAPILIPRIDVENLAEIDGIVEGLAAAGVHSTREEMVTFNAIIELAGYWWPEKKRALGSRAPDPRKQSCSSFIATGSMTADGQIVLGHNTMSDYTQADANIILDIQPETGARILMQATPGWIHSGTDFFITDAGLVGAETTIGGFRGFDTTGIPEFSRMRRATQDAHTIDEWCAIMRQGNNGGYANAWLIGDINSGEIARLELGLMHTGFERTRDGFYTGSNIAENLQILRFETDEHDTDIRRSGVARRVRWNQLMRENRGKIDLARAKHFEADHYDAFLRREALSGRALCGHVEWDSLDMDVPFDTWGTVDGKVVDTPMARAMTFAARWGSACGTPFDATAYLKRHPQFSWTEGALKSRASYPWVTFRAGERQE
jgi:hypothetical protein